MKPSIIVTFCFVSIACLFDYHFFLKYIYFISLTENLKDSVLERNRVDSAELLVAARAHVRMGSVSGTTILIAHKLEKDR